jgi:hypothetical protein
MYPRKLRQVFENGPSLISGVIRGGMHRVYDDIQGVGKINGDACFTIF